MARSIWKGPSIDKSIWKRLKKLTNTSNQIQENSILAKPKLSLGGDSKVRVGSQIQKIYNRRSMIIPEFIRRPSGTSGSEDLSIRCEIHTGNKWINLNISEDRIGHLFGEFAPTKKVAQYKRKSKTKGKKK